MHLLLLYETIIMGLNREKELKDLLDHHYDWPDTFMFKFIYKSNQETEDRLKEIFSENSEFTIKSSTKQNFNSMSVKHLASSAKEVMDIYNKASEIEGVISL